MLLMATICCTLEFSESILFRYESPVLLISIWQQSFGFWAALYWNISFQIPATVDGAVGGAIAPPQLSVYVPFQIWGRRCPETQRRSRSSRCLTLSDQRTSNNSSWWLSDHPESDTVHNLYRNLREPQTSAHPVHFYFPNDNALISCKFQMNL